MQRRDRSVVACARRIAGVASLSAGAWLAGCGLKGNLVLPPSAQASAASAVEAAQAAAAAAPAPPVPLR